MKGLNCKEMDRILKLVNKANGKQAIEIARYAYQKAMDIVWEM